MKRTTKLGLIALVGLSAIACKKSDKNIEPIVTTNTLTFEERGLPVGTFIDVFGNGIGFQEMEFQFNNDTAQYAGSYYWTTGWSISSMTDISNVFEPHTSASGNGAAMSNTYLTGTYDAYIATMGKKVLSLDVNNAIFASNSMLNGDQFAKQFGGVSGDDADYFMLTIKNAEGDSVNHMLADYTFADNTQDYIQTNWTTVDVSSLGNTQMLHFILRSTDNGTWGMNTPAFFCVDNIIYEK